MKRLLLLCLILCLTACNPLYVTRAAWEEARVLAAREAISDLLARGEISEIDRVKLELVRDAGNFAREIGLTEKPPYRSFSRVDRPTFSWVLVACRPDSFELFSWWFPVLGNVPYKGYFEKSDAERMGRYLSEMGYEISIRPADAISTLGWFDDPLLSTALKNESSILVNIVFHEALHTKIWLPEDVAYNETLASFTGARASIDFFLSREAACQTESCRKDNDALLSRAREIMAFELELSDTLDLMFPEMEALFESDKSRDEKLKLRLEIFNRHITPLRARYPKWQGLRELNNADLIQQRLYATSMRSFRDEFEKCDSNWGCFLGAVQERTDPGLTRD